MSEYWFHCGDGPALFLEHCTEGVDHVIMDPPYWGNVYANQRKTPGKGTYKGGNHGQHEGRDLGHAPLSEDLCDRLAQVVAMHCRGWCLLFSDFEDSASLWRQQLVYYGMQFVRTGVWHKEGAQPQITGDRPAQGCEAILIFHAAGPMAWNGGGLHAFWSHPIAPSRPGRHPTEKPIGLLQTLVEQFTNHGDLVADLTAGCASTGVAALSRGRKFFGVELDPRYHAEGLRRLARTREQTSLFPLSSAMQPDHE